MKECKNSSHYLSKYFFSDISDEERNKIEAHIRNCEVCRPLFKSYKKTLELMDLRERPEPEKPFLNNFWEHLADRYPEFREKPKESFAEKLKGVFSSGVSLFAQPAFSRGASAVALVVIGIFIGKYFFTGNDITLPAGPSGSVTVSPIVQQANNYLETSKIILVNILNLNGEGAERDYSLEKETSNKLVKDARFIKANLGDSERERRIKELMEDLEVILLELSNLSEERSHEEIKFLSDGIKTKGILFKIRMYEMSQNEKGEIKNET